VAARRLEAPSHAEGFDGIRCDPPGRPSHSGCEISALLPPEGRRRALEPARWAAV